MPVFTVFCYGKIASLKRNTLEYAKLKFLYFNFCRVLVPPTMVGAIIGKEGKKIKDLTEKTETE